MERNRLTELMDRAYEEARPITAQLELTYKCNLLCSFCYNAPQERPELNGAQWIDAIRKCRGAGSVYVIVTGGEPMVHRDFWEIAEAVRSEGLVLKVYTNGVLLADADRAKRFAELMPFETEISLHGATSNVHDRLAGIRGSFDKIVEGLGHLSRHGVKVTIKTPITRLNQHQLADVEKLGARFGYKITFDTNILPTDDGDRSTFSLAPDREFLANFFVDQVRRGARGLNPRPVAKMKHNCGTGRTIVTIDPYGEIYPCVAFRRSLGNILEVDDLGALWTGKDGTVNANLAYVRKVADEVPKRVLANHAEGGYASFCPGAAERETGSPFTYYGAARMSGLTKLDAFRRIQAEDAGAERDNAVKPANESLASGAETA